MTGKNHLFAFLLIFMAQLLWAQDNDERRFTTIENQLEALSVDTTGLTESLNINIQNTTLTNLLLATSKVHKVNINVSPELNSISIVNNFSNVTVANLLLFLCKEYDLDIEFIGNILSISKYQKPPEIPKEKEIQVRFDPQSQTITLDLQGDPLQKAFRAIMDTSGKNLLWSTGMENIPLTLYLRDVPFDRAMENLAVSNNLDHQRSRDGFYLFERTNSVSQGNNSSQPSQQGQRPQRSRMSNFFFKVLDKESKLLEVDFVNTPIESIINDIGTELDIDIFTASPLLEAGTATLKAKEIGFDTLLVKLFEARGTASVRPSNGQQNNQSTPTTASSDLTFKKEYNIYYFGKASQLTVKSVEVIPLLHRSIEILADPSTGTGRSVGRNSFNTGGSFNSSLTNQGFQNNTSSINNRSDFNRGGSFNNRGNNRLSSGGGASSQGSSLLELIPDELLQGLDIKTDFELNNFVVQGPSQSIERFRSFVQHIDKPVPVVLIEVMILEINRSATVDTGVEWGIGDEPVEDGGDLFPTTDFTLGAETLNKVIGGIDGFSSIQLVPNFFARIKAMESNGIVKVRSTPKLATLNGHRATFSNGETTYYAITQNFTIGANNPVIESNVNYVPIDAELGLTIKPLVSGDGKVTLDIFVIQSDFNGERIDENAPPGINSREFSSIISVDNKDIVVLGGLEEKIRNDSGSGVPILSRIPVIKWLFSRRNRQDSKRKLTVLIKPTVIN